MSWILAIIAGAIIGWLASLVMKTDQQQGCFLNIIIGVIGSALGNWLFGNIFGFSSAGYAGSFSLLGILWGVIGAVVLIAILRALRILK